MAEGADVGDVGPGREQRVGHDRAVATKFFQPRVELDVRAHAGGGGDALAEVGHVSNRREVLALGAAEANRGDDEIDKTIEAHDGAPAADAIGVVAQAVQGVLAVHGGTEDPRKGKACHAGNGSECEFPGFSIERAVQTRQLFLHFHPCLCRHSLFPPSPPPT